MNTYAIDDITIAVVNEPLYADRRSSHSYSKQYISEESDYKPSSVHGVKIYRDNKLVNDCLLIGHNGATGVHENSSLLDGDLLLVCCGNSVFCLHIPDLQLKWKKTVDEYTCFSIRKLGDDYLVHGERAVTRFDKDGNIHWHYSGKDIFVSLKEEKGFSIENGIISVVDFLGIRYLLDSDGSLLRTEMAGTSRNGNFAPLRVSLGRLFFYWSTSATFAIGGYVLLWLVMPDHMVFGGLSRMMAYHAQNPILFILIPCFFYGIFATYYANSFLKVATQKRIFLTLKVMALTVVVSSPFGGMLYFYLDMQAGYFPAHWVSRMISSGITEGLTAGWLIIALSVPYNIMGAVICYFITKAVASLIRTP